MKGEAFSWRERAGPTPPGVGGWGITRLWIPSGVLACILSLEMPRSPTARYPGEGQDSDSSRATCGFPLTFDFTPSIQVE